jgi:hypothetical protein
MRRRNEKGQAILLVVISTSIFVIGAVGLVIDGAQIYAQREMAQSAADGAAIAGIMSIFDKTWTSPTASTCSTTSTAIPCTYGRLNGFGVATAEVAYDFPTPDSIGVPASKLSSDDDPNLIRVTITRNLNTTLMRLLGSTGSTAKASAVAAIASVLSPIPIIVLHPTLAGSFAINGGPTIKICGGPTRSIQVNSCAGSGRAGCDASDSLSIGGSNTVDLSKAGPKDDGNCTTGTGADFGDNGGPKSYPGTLLLGTFPGKYIQPASPIADPLKDVGAPPLPTSNGPTFSIGAAATVRYGCPGGQTCTLYGPGLYSGGIDIKNDWALFWPGVYYITGSGFNMDSNSAANMADMSLGPPVTTPPFPSSVPAGFTEQKGMLVYNTGNGGSDIFNFNANAGSKGPVILKGADGSDTSHAYQGILFFEDRNITTAHTGHGSSKAHTIQGGGTISLQGTVYIRNFNQASNYQSLSLQGNPGSSTTIQGEIIVDALSLGGNAGITMNLDAGKHLTVRQVALVK